jgi:ribosomal protein S18 acetylase RimI-like enzyme
MTPQFPRLNRQEAGLVPSLCTARCLSARQLTEENKTEVLHFLAQRPLHTAVMSGFIRDNGLESDFNRGRFYACRNEVGALEGVTLIGHSMFIEARSDDALREFARLAQEFRHAHMIMGEQEMIAVFWNYYSAGGQPPRHVSREILFDLDQCPETFPSVPNLRLANLDDLSLVMPVHAMLAFEESGVNPLLTDPHGFRMRYRRRIEQDRVWVWIERGQLIFKAEVITDTPDVIYVEGVYVNPNERGQGYGSSCIAQMSRYLLRRTKSISVLVNEENRQARKFFQTAGFTSRALYDTIFLQNQTQLQMTEKS